MLPTDAGAVTLTLPPANPSIILFYNWHCVIFFLLFIFLGLVSIIACCWQPHANTLCCSWLLPRMGLSKLCYSLAHLHTFFFLLFFVGPKKINFLVVLLHASCGVYLFPLLFLIFLGVQYWLVLPPPHRSMEFSLYQETSDPQMQEVTPKEPSADPGTLVWSSSSTHAHINALHTQKQCSFTWTPIYYSKN